MSIIPVANTNHPADGLFVSDNFVYIGESTNGVRIFNITNKLLPTFVSAISSVELPGDCDDIILIENESIMIVGCGGYGVVVVNTTDKTNP